MATLVVLNQAAPMALCNICPQPGRCCQRFKLSNSSGELTYWEDNWEADVEAYLRTHGMPFRGVIRERYTVTDPDHPDFGRSYVTLSYSCPKLDAAGRCSIYESRPDACRSFVPGTDTLCVFG